MAETEEIQQILWSQTTSIEQLSINYFYNSDNINAIKPHPVAGLCIQLKVNEQAESQSSDYLSGKAVNPLMTDQSSF